MINTYPDCGVNFTHDFVASDCVISACYLVDCESNLWSSIDPLEGYHQWREAFDIQRLRLESQVLLRWSGTSNHSANAKLELNR